MGKFKCNCDLFFGTDKLITFEEGKWDEQDFGTFFRTLVRNRPVNFIVRGLSGLGKTTLCDFVASNILNCLSIDIDKFRSLGRSFKEPDPHGYDYQVLQQLIDVLVVLKSNICSSITSAGLTEETAKKLCYDGFDNIIAEFYLIRESNDEIIDFCFENNIHDVPREQIEKQLAIYKKWPCKE